MVQLVEQMLAAKEQLAAAKIDTEKTYYTSRCAGLERQMDRLVYDLYGLTRDEIEIVEERGGGQGVPDGDNRLFRGGRKAGGGKLGTRPREN